MAKLCLLSPEKARLFVGVKYLNASTFLFQGLKRSAGTNDFHFLVTLRSFIDYTRRGIWYLVWASEDHIQIAMPPSFTFKQTGIPDTIGIDSKIRHAIGLSPKSPLGAPLPGLKGEKFLDCLHSLTHGNPAAVTMLARGLRNFFDIDNYLVGAEEYLAQFQIILYRLAVGEKIGSIWQTLGVVRSAVMLRAMVKVSAKRARDAAVFSEIEQWAAELPPAQS